jgi:ABC-type branched-subunit amino acid transport system ATPase component
MENIVQTRNLTRRFGGLVAVNNLDFAFQRGEVRGLIGPNGSGKTTLINLISGVYEPSAGAIFFGDRQISGWSPNRIAASGLLRTFQVPRLFGSMSVLENMLIPRFADFRLSYTREYGGAVHRAEGLLEMAGLFALRDSPSRILSGGQKALLQLVRGFMIENLRVYLLDEPFSGVNIVVKDTIMKLINQKATEGVSFLLVSHEMASIRQTCARVTVLAQGSIITEGTMEEIVAHEEVISAYLGGTA